MKTQIITLSAFLLSLTFFTATVASDKKKAEFMDKFKLWAQNDTENKYKAFIEYLATQQQYSQQEKAAATVQATALFREAQSQKNGALEQRTTFEAYSKHKLEGSLISGFFFQYKSQHKEESKSTTQKS